MRFYRTKRVQVVSGGITGKVEVGISRPIRSATFPPAPLPACDVPTHGGIPPDPTAPAGPCRRNRSDGIPQREPHPRIRSGRIPPSGYYPRNRADRIAATQSRRHDADCAVRSRQFSAHDIRNPFWRKSRGIPMERASIRHGERQEHRRGRLANHSGAFRPLPEGPPRGDRTPQEWFRDEAFPGFGWDRRRPQPAVLPGDAAP